MPRPRAPRPRSPPGPERPPRPGRWGHCRSPSREPCLKSSTNHPRARHDPAGERIEAMNEVQGPTPTGTSRPYRSLAEALRAHRLPVENHDFIGAVVDAVSVTSFIDRGRYIEALRREGAPLHI